MQYYVHTHTHNLYSYHICMQCDRYANQITLCGHNTLIFSSEMFHLVVALEKFEGHCAWNKTLPSLKWNVSFHKCMTCSCNYISFIYFFISLNIPFHAASTADRGNWKYMNYNLYSLIILILMYWRRNDFYTTTFNQCTCSRQAKVANLCNRQL
jgi:hypothetical protein